MSILTKIREEQTELFLSHAFAWVTPAIYVALGGLRSETLVFIG